MAARRFAGSHSTSLLLQKASAQLSGGQVPGTMGRAASATVNDDDDALAVSCCCCASPEA